MSDEEKLERHQKLYKVVTTHTSHTWAALLVKMLLAQMDDKNTARQTPYIPKALLQAKYKLAKKRLFLFDYDVRIALAFICLPPPFSFLIHDFFAIQVTLAPIVKTPSAAVPSEPTLLALTKLSEDPKNLVYIISGRDGKFLEQHLGHLSKIGFSAEHGAFVKEAGETEWTNFTEALDMSWMAEVHEIFKYYTEVCVPVLAK